MAFKEHILHLLKQGDVAKAIYTMEKEIADEEYCKSIAAAKVHKLGWDSCVRLYNSKGEHVLSILRCHDCENDLDLADPNGKVLFCADHGKVLVTFLEGNRFPMELIEERNRQLNIVV